MFCVLHVFCLFTCAIPVFICVYLCFTCAIPVFICVYLCFTCAIPVFICVYLCFTCGYLFLNCVLPVVTCLTCGHLYLPVYLPVSYVWSPTCVLAVVTCVSYLWSPVFTCVLIWLPVFPGVCSALHYYYVVDKAMTWMDAQSYCREHYNDLATVDGLEDQQRLEDAAGGHTGPAWIGLYDDVKSWTWSDPSVDSNGDVDPWSWSGSQPDNSKTQEGCVLMHDKKWRDRDCNDSLDSVCYNSSSKGEPTCR